MKINQTGKITTAQIEVQKENEDRQLARFSYVMIIIINLNKTISINNDFNIKK